MKFILQILLIFALQGLLSAENGNKTKITGKYVSGKITTEQGEEIAGAKITIKETGKVYFADLNGNFKLQLESAKLFHIAFETSGYVPVELKSTDLTLFSELSLKELSTNPL